MWATFNSGSHWFRLAEVRAQVVCEFIHQQHRQRQHTATETNERKVAELLQQHVRGSTLKSYAAIAETSNIDVRSVKSMLIEFGCIVIHGSALLVGSLLSGLCDMIKGPQKKFTPIATFSKWKYDETPMRLRVDQWNMIFGEDPLHIATSKRTGEAFSHAKVFCIDWEFGH